MYRPITRKARSYKNTLALGETRDLMLNEPSLLEVDRFTYNLTCGLMSKLIRCPKCGRKPDVQEIHFDNMLLGIWCRDCGSVKMELKLPSSGIDCVEQERRKIQRKKAK